MPFGAAGPVCQEWVSLDGGDQGSWPQRAGSLPPLLEHRRSSRKIAIPRGLPGQSRRRDFGRRARPAASPQPHPEEPLDLLIHDGLVGEDTRQHLAWPLEVGVRGRKPLFHLRRRHHLAAEPPELARPEGEKDGLRKKDAEILRVTAPRELVTVVEGVRRGRLLARCRTMPLPPCVMLRCEGLPELSRALTPPSQRR
jgi:hypothetical protein